MYTKTDTTLAKPSKIVLVHLPINTKGQVRPISFFLIVVLSAEYEIILCVDYNNFATFITFIRFCLDFKLFGNISGNILVGS